jgi:hypothetical protein
MFPNQRVNMGKLLNCSLFVFLHSQEPNTDEKWGLMVFCKDSSPEKIMIVVKEKRRECMEMMEGWNHGWMMKLPVSRRLFDRWWSYATAMWLETKLTMERKKNDSMRRKQISSVLITAYFVNWLWQTTCLSTILVLLLLGGICLWFVNHSRLQSQERHVK